MIRPVRFFHYLLFVSAFSCGVHAQQKDYLDDDWGADFDVSLSTNNNESSSAVETSTFMEKFWEQASLKLKSDIAYQDEISLARGMARFDATARPFPMSFFKIDLQYTYYHQKDTLVQSSDSVQHALKINDAWFQYTHDVCNAKVGRQKLFWGAVEGSYALDKLMPLDLTEPLLTDFSLIRRSQDMAVFTCFMSGLDVEWFFTPQPVLDQSTVRQTENLQSLEEELDYEWAGRLTRHFEGLDVGIYFARLYENTPQPVIDFTAMRVSGYQLNQFNLYGLSLVYAIDRLLLEADVSYQEQRKKIADGVKATLKSLKYRSEAALGLEYTTQANHQISAGVWFYSYLSTLNPDMELYAQVWNINWSRQYWNDDLTLSALALWQKQPDSGQITLMADYLWDDQWSSAFAVSYSAPSSAISDAALSHHMEQGWRFNLSLEYQY